MEYKTYVCRKRARFKAICGQVNIPYGTTLNGQGGFLILNDLPVCSATSQNAYDFFTQNDDGMGQERGELLNRIIPKLEKRERIRNERYWELLGEDLIYFDELRWKTWKDKKFATYDDNGKQVVNGLRQVWGQATYHYAWGGDHYWLYPIPYNETQMNPNMEQNPGWK